MVCVWWRTAWRTAHGDLTVLRHATGQFLEPSRIRNADATLFAVTACSEPYLVETPAQRVIPGREQARRILCENVHRTLEEVEKESTRECRDQKRRGCDGKVGQRGHSEKEEDTNEALFCELTNDFVKLWPCASCGRRSGNSSTQKREFRGCAY